MFISFNAIKLGKLTLDDVPTEYKAQVEAILNEGA
jgi:hypothetical protein